MRRVPGGGACKLRNTRILPEAPRIGNHVYAANDVARSSRHRKGAEFPLRTRDPGREPENRSEVEQEAGQS